MKERPILFSSAMVRAILAGAKTQTRRIVSNRHLGFIGCSGEEGDPNAWGYYAEGRDFSGWMVLARGVMDLVGNNQDRASIPCPYGAVGDRLWVRETFASYASAGTPAKPSDAGYVVLADGTQVYRDGTKFAPNARYANGAFDGITWRPSIHMPRWASRITLEITDVRVERLQDISEEDARAEGMTPTTVSGDDGSVTIDARDKFSVLWDEINGERASWESDPWVWAISFKRLP